MTNIPAFSLGNGRGCILENRMSLKYKRNISIVLFSITVLTFLVLALGDQPIIAYFVN